MKARDLNREGIVLYKSGHWQEAVHCYQRALDIQPDYTDAYFNIGLAYAKLGQYQAAIASWHALLILNPSHVAAHFQLGLAYMKRDEYDEAIDYFEWMISQDSDHYESYLNLGASYLALDSFVLAKEAYLSALRISPREADAWYNLGVIYTSENHFSQAIYAYQQAISVNHTYYEAYYNLALLLMKQSNYSHALSMLNQANHIRPNQPEVVHLLRVLSQDRQLSDTPSAFVTSLFDQYAETYDHDMTQELHYVLPDVLKEAIQTYHASQTHVYYQQGLDIGCGTGLSAKALFQYVKQWDGVDVSPNMLQKASQKSIYKTLYCEEWMSYLRRVNDQYDFILAGDVLIYSGDLVDKFAQIYNHLNLKGVFLFNVEAGDQYPYDINISGRFRHHLDYIKASIKPYPWTLCYSEKRVVRYEKGEPVFAYVCILQK